MSSNHIQDQASSVLPQLLHLTMHSTEAEISRGDETPLVHCANLWFQDGTVVLKTDFTLFKVFKGILASHSPVFRDMFSIPQPESCEKYEGCPLVVMHDNADDMREFLLSLFVIRHVERNVLRNIHRLASVLRLATKYDVPVLRQCTVDQLRQWWPSTLGSWQESENDMIESLLAVRLAREHHVPAILPAALYEIATQTSNLFSHALFGDPHNPAQPSLQHHPVDARACISAREKLRVAHNTRCCAFLFDAFPKPGCLHGLGACESAARQVLRRRDIVWGEPLVNETSVVVGSWPLDRFYLTRGFCSVCATAFQASYTEASLEIWEDLPRFFGLPSWDELHRDTK